MMKQDIPHKDNMLKCMWISMMGKLDAQLVKLKLKPSRAQITCHEFAELMQSVIDHETTDEERVLFQKQQEKCEGCSKKFVTEQKTIELIRMRLERDKQYSPQELETSIRNKILFS